MGRIFLLMGKSASGKDSLRRQILGDIEGLSTYTPYTTRPLRKGERPGDEYFFIDEAELERLGSEGRVIEQRTYETVHGPWIYATVDDGQIDLAKASTLMEGTLESYLSLRDYFGSDNVVPLYIEVDDGTRLSRAILREELEPEPRYAEVCRRFLADNADFSEDNLERAGIDIRYKNDDIFSCAASIEEEILKDAGL